jgi:hypothetical protein
MVAGVEALAWSMFLLDGISNPSCPALCRASTSLEFQRKIWMAGTIGERSDAVLQTAMAKREMAPFFDRPYPAMPIMGDATCAS